ncbi:MAG: IS200/IS605 family transposase [Planctomycetes bacterium]|nr:IS200/IS605 family transposase [Planctomycetota bacterium]
MSSHVFHEIFLHLNWHTKSDHPTLQEQVEQLAHTFLRDKAKRLKGLTLHELGGTDTRVHLAVQIEPFLAVSEMVQELKGAASHEVNRRTGHKALEWQRGYGVVSFGRKHLPWGVEHIRRQREQHADGTVERRLEAYEPDAFGA